MVGCVYYYCFITEDRKKLLKSWSAKNGAIIIIMMVMMLNLTSIGPWFSFLFEEILYCI